jgi:site-specific DNA recombinase
VPHPKLKDAKFGDDVSERQCIMRLLVKEILVGDDKIIIRHCMPLPNRSGDVPPDGGINTAPPGTEGYLLRSRSPVAVAVQHRAR